MLRLVVLMLLFVSVVDTRAESTSISDSAAIRKIASASVRPELSTAYVGPAFMQMQRIPRYRRPCNPKRRAFAGAAIGFVTGMVVVQKVAGEYDTTIGAKDTLLAGSYGAALGTFVGLATCR